MSLQKGLVGHWTMDDRDTSGGTIFDRSAQDNHGSMNGGITTGATGQVGEAFSFDGSDDYISPPDSYGVSGSNPVSLVCWINPDDVSTGGWLMNIFTDVGSGWGPRISSGNVEIYDDSGGNDTSHYSTAIDNSWHHIVALVTSSGEMQLYVDSSQVGSGVSIDATTVDAFYIGQRGNGSHLSGDFDDVRVYDRALSSEEISALYNMRSSRQQRMSLSKGLVNHLTLDNDDLSGGTLYDRSAYDTNAETRGSVTTGANGQVGEAFTFDGTDDYLPSNYFHNTTTLSEISVSAWFKTGSTGEQIIASTDRNEYWRLGPGADASDGMQWTVSSSDMVSSASLSSLADNNWHHVVGVFDASLTNDHKIYLDGSLDSEANFFSSGIGSGNASYMIVGTGSEASSFDGSQGPNYWFNGEMDDLRIYERRITASEVERLYNKRSL